MEADTAFVAHTRAANDVFGARQLANCEALLDWATSATTPTASGNHGKHNPLKREGQSDHDAALSRRTLAKWGLTMCDESLNQC